MSANRPFDADAEAPERTIDDCRASIERLALSLAYAAPNDPILTERSTIRQRSTIGRSRRKRRAIQRRPSNARSARSRPTRRRKRDCNGCARPRRRTPTTSGSRGGFGIIADRATILSKR
jgi:hypothetical protein